MCRRLIAQHPHTASLPISGWLSHVSIRVNQICLAQIKHVKRDFGCICGLREVLMHKEQNVDVGKKISN